MYVETLLKNYSSLDAVHLLTRISLKGGFLKLPDVTVDEELKDEYYNSIVPDYTKLSFHNWNELFDEISEKIANFNNNETQISRYVYSLLMPFNAVSKFLFPSGSNNTEFSDLSSFIWKYAHKKFFTEEMLKGIHKKADEKFKETVYTTFDKNGKVGNPYLDFIQEETNKIGMTNDYLDHKFLIEIIYVIARLASAIEGALLINGTQNGLFEYQDKCGVVICKSFSAKRLCEHLGWTAKLANQYMPFQIDYFEYNTVKNTLKHYRKTNVRGINLLLTAKDDKNVIYSSEKHNLYLSEFRKQCSSIANGNSTVDEKEVWIVSILTALAFVNCGGDDLKDTDYVQYSYEYWAELEAAFLVSPIQICIRKIAVDLGLSDILDAYKPYKYEVLSNIDTENMPKRMTWTQSELWPIVGWKLQYEEKKICMACERTDCRYRYGIKNTTWREIHDAELTDYRVKNSNEERQQNELPCIGNDEKKLKSDRISYYMNLASDLYENGEWKGSSIKEYAIFLKELYRVVYKKEGRFNVLWEKLKILPMKGGKIVTAKQLTNGIRNYNEVDDAPILLKFQQILGNQ